MVHTKDIHFLGTTCSLLLPGCIAHLVAVPEDHFGATSLSIILTLNDASGIPVFMQNCRLKGMLAVHTGEPHIIEERADQFFQQAKLTAQYTYEGVLITISHAIKGDSFFSETLVVPHDIAAQVFELPTMAVV